MNVKYIVVVCAGILLVITLFYTTNVFTTYETLLSEYQGFIKAANTIKDKAICYDADLMVHAAVEMRELCKHERQWQNVNVRRRALFDAMMKARKTTFDISGLVDLIKTVGILFFGLGFFIAVLTGTIYFLWLRKCPPCHVNHNNNKKKLKLN